MKIWKVCIILLWIAALSACNAAPTASIATETSAPASLPQSTSGSTGTVTAKLINNLTEAPVALQLVRLAKIVGEGTNSVYVYNENADPGAYTTEDGILTIGEVAPGDYAVILVDANSNISTIAESPEKILTVTVPAGQTVDMGVIRVDLAPTQTP